MQAVKVRIGGDIYEVMDSLSNITLADSFVKNKIGTGHGEAKLYVGNVLEKLQIDDKRLYYLDYHKAYVYKG